MKAFIDNLTLREYEQFRKRVMNELNVTRTCFANWKAGCMPSKRHRDSLNQIATEIKGVEIFS